jgi:hypothetical protein
VRSRYTGKKTDGGSRGLVSQRRTYVPISPVSANQELWLQTTNSRESKFHLTIFVSFVPTVSQR